MLPSLRLANAHKPLIRFLGKRQWPAKPGVQHPHPFAPPEAKQHFADFLKKFQSSSSSAPASASAVSSSSKTARRARRSRSSGRRRLDCGSASCRTRRSSSSRVEERRCTGYFTVFETDLILIYGSLYSPLATRVH
ncbi:hypothetical protein C8Q78DRAFT_998837 [Trametes maxima]|nr:hypothetical protein C8Q78DRAFT_998837 [Trametes maxima]